MEGESRLIQIGCNEIVVLRSSNQIFEAPSSKICNSLNNFEPISTKLLAIFPRVYHTLTLSVAVY